MSNKRRATYHPYDGPSHLDRMEADGVDYSDIHGTHKGFVVVLVLLVGFWSALIGYIAWAVTR